MPYPAERLFWDIVARFCAVCATLILALVGGMAASMALLFGHYALGWWVNP